MSELQENKEGLELLKTAIAKAGYTGKVSVIFSSLVISYMVSNFSLLLNHSLDGDSL